MSYTREKIASAKVGEHWLRWSPWGEEVSVRVTKVRGFHVWVQTATSQPPHIRLNWGASQLLIEGAYRRA